MLRAKRRTWYLWTEGRPCRHMNSLIHFLKRLECLNYILVTKTENYGVCRFNIIVQYLYDVTCKVNIGGINVYYYEEFNRLRNLLRTYEEIVYETGEYEELRYYGRKLRYIGNPSNRILEHDDEKFNDEWREFNEPNAYITVTDYDCRG